MDPWREYQLLQTRRQLLGRTATGVGTAALASLMNPGLFAATVTVPRRRRESLGEPHFPAKAKRVIYLFMSGAPSQLDLFDYKPTMDELFDTDLPDSIRKGQRLTTMTSGQERFPIAPSMFKFAQHGGAGHGSASCCPTPRQWSTTSASSRASTPRRSITTRRSPTSRPATSFPAGRQLGAWLSYGLGSMNDDLPAFVVLHSVVDWPQVGAGPLRPAVGDRLPAQRARRRVRSGPRATRCCTSRTRPASARADGRRMLDALSAPQPAAVRRLRRPGDATRASPSTRWPTGCRPPCRS